MSVLVRLRASSALVCCSIAALLSISVPAQGQTYPAKPIRLVIPFGAGGITDVAGRLVGQHLAEELKQQVIIDNRPGAGGGIGAQAVAQAQPDGYTLLLGTVGTQVVNKMIYRKLNYDPAALTPITLVSNSPYVLAVNGLDGVKDLNGLASYAKLHPGALNFGSAGNGSSPHLSLELFKLATKAEIVHVPFKSGAEAVNAAIGGQVQVVCDAIPVIQPQAQAGRLKILGITASHRNPAIPNVATSAEQGLTDFQIGSWNALVGPPGMSPSQVTVLSDAMARVLKNPALLGRLSEMGIEPMPTGVAAYEAHVRTETAKWAKVVQAAGTKLD